MRSVQNIVNSKRWFAYLENGETVYIIFVIQTAKRECDRIFLVVK